MNKLIILTLLLFSGFIFSCSRPEIKDSSESMRLTDTPDEIWDDLSLDQLEEAISKNIGRLKEIKTETLNFGPETISKVKYIKSLNYLADNISSGITKDDFLKLVKDNFDFYEVYGNDKWGQVFITSYFAPLYNGSRQKTPLHSQPLYSTPSDLVDIRIDEFIETRDDLSPLKDSLSGKPLMNILRGRLLTDSKGRSKVVPYHSRREIDEGNVLDNRDIVLAWVDPVDAFFMHVQGSGAVKFEDGEELMLGYASKNGHRYRSIGKHLLSVIPKNNMSMQSIDKYLRTLPEDEMMEILYINPSYVFFRKIEGKPRTSFGTEVVDGRTIATDKRYFPKGALAYLEFPSPVFNDETSDEPADWENTSRFVFDHDTGGAIKGPGRVDLFWGSGKEAARYAGVMKNQGKLYYLVPKDKFIYINLR